MPQDPQDLGPIRTPIASVQPFAKSAECLQHELAVVAASRNRAACEAALRRGVTLRREARVTCWAQEPLRSPRRNDALCDGGNAQARSRSSQRGVVTTLQRGWEPRPLAGLGPGLGCDEKSLTETVAGSGGSSFEDPGPKLCSPSQGAAAKAERGGARPPSTRLPELPRSKQPGAARASHRGSPRPHASPGCPA